MEGEEAFYEMWTIREFGNSFIFIVVEPLTLPRKEAPSVTGTLSVLALPP